MTVVVLWWLFSGGYGTLIILIRASGVRGILPPTLLIVGMVQAPVRWFSLSLYSPSSARQAAPRYSTFSEMAVG